MPFSFDETQEDLRALAVEYLQNRAPLASLHLDAESVGPSDRDRAIWRSMTTDLGLQAVDVSEAAGGAGLTAVEMALVMEAAGGELYAGPLLSSAGFAQGLVQERPEAAAQSIVARLVAGEVAAAAAAGPGGRWNAATAGTSAHLTPSSESGSASWVLNGSADHVLQANLADVLLVMARRPGDLITLVAVERTAAVVTEIPSIDPTRSACRVEFNNAACEVLVEDASHVLEAGGQRAGLALAAESVGPARRCLEIAVAHAKQREQFGHPIGSFQGVKHPLVDAFVDLELATTAVYLAACHLAAGDGRSSAASVPLALMTALDCLSATAALSVQVHGGMGFTWESHCHQFVKRAAANRQLLGPVSDHRLSVYNTAAVLAS